MDVRCERCGTEYEFDDALVSGRGTTVKCTNCGHKFKIRRSDGDFAEDFWNVQTVDGRTLVFTSLRELQRAIQGHLVERNDMLSRGGLPPKAIGGIPELSPFFDQREARDTRGSLPPTPRAEIAYDVGAGRGRPPPPPGAVAPALAPPRQRQSTRPDFPAPPAVLSAHGAHKNTMPGTGDDLTPAVPAMRSRMASVRPGELSASPDVGTADTALDPGGAPTPPTPTPPNFSRTQPLRNAAFRPQPTLPGVAPPAQAPSGAPGSRTSRPPPLPRGRSGPPPPAPVVRPAEGDRPEERRVAATPTTPPAVARPPTSPLAASHVAPAVEPLDTSSPLPPPRVSVRDAEDHERSRSTSPSFGDAPASVNRGRPVGGYVVAAIVLLGVGLLGAVWARDNLGRVTAPKAAAPAAVDPRVAGFLAAGEQALADGNLDLAKESFDKASTLVERDPRLLLDSARLAAARADVLWLKARLLPADATDEHRLVREGLTENAQTARKSADAAIAVAPDDPAALRAKIDALRISGDREGARALVGKLGGSATQPETAYVLAALDLAETEPLWPTVIERLRVAASAESGPGRARAALAYALARSGDPAGAKAEVDRLAGMSRQHPLVPQLRAFADRARTAPAERAQADAGVADAGAVAATGTVSAADRAADTKAGAPAGGRTGLSGDPRVLVSQGEAARNRGDYEKARMLYSAALDKNANDSEALHGLAAIAHAQRDLSGARASYKRVLAINPTYLPALVGLADVEWESGDRASATKTYKEIVDRFPEGTYPARIRQRLDAGGDKPAGGHGEPGGGG